MEMSMNKSNNLLCLYCNIIYCIVCVIAIYWLTRIVYVHRNFSCSSVDKWCICSC